MTTGSALHWRIPIGQRLLFEDFGDRVLMFDSLVGGTHLLNASAAEALAIIEEFSGLALVDIHRRLLERLSIGDDALPVALIDELLWQLENLNVVCATAE